MKIITIDKQSWARGLAEARQTYRLFGPVQEGAFFNFRALSEGEIPDLSHSNTRMSAKALIYPQSQILFDYSLDEHGPDGHILREVPVDEAPRAVVGIRPCDADAFLLVKRNFDTPEYQDPYWLKAFEATTFVGLACTRPCPTCFCTTAGSGPFNEAALDVLLVRDGERLLARAVTAKGQAFLKACNWTQEAGDGAADRLASLKRQAEDAVVSRVSTEQLANKATTDLYDAPFWDDVAFACINCGTCTYLCPTCWCFDIQDETFGKSGIRMRNWDSCMYPLFTLHGSGHNPRGQKVQRVRQRFMHKLKYYVDKYGDGIQCVGCGRCVQHCPVNIDIRTVCEKMNSFGTTGAACEVS